ncbi:MAG: hypothetical protein U5K71_04215 [Gracilimonas sp.]|nr:hypothetical protein [Gracilimonas sp.]
MTADPYESGATNSQAGVPLVLERTTSIDEESNVSRATVEEVYTQISQNDLGACQIVVVMTLNHWKGLTHCLATNDGERRTFPGLFTDG